jgi:hypothetical protein
MLGSKHRRIPRAVTTAYQGIFRRGLARNHLWWFFPVSRLLTQLLLDKPYVSYNWDYNPFTDWHETPSGKQLPKFQIKLVLCMLYQETKASLRRDGPRNMHLT